MNEDKSNQENIDIARAWKDEEYRNSLTPEQLATIPPNPAGETELDEEDLGNVSGGGLANGGRGTAILCITTFNGVCNPLKKD